MTDNNIDFSEIERLIGEGVTYREIAKQMNISHYDLDVIAGAMGTARTKLLLKRQIIAEMKADGYSVQEIADAVGLRPCTVNARLAQMKHHI